MKKTPAKFDPTLPITDTNCWIDDAPEVLATVEDVDELDAIIEAEKTRIRKAATIVLLPTWKKPR